MGYKADGKRYKNKDYIKCGNSGLKIPPLSVGLWKNFGFQDSFSNARKLIRYAFDHGITHFDLANNYGPPYGSAETQFGRIFKRDLQPYRDEMIIATKAGYDMWPGPYGNWGSRKYLLASLDQSLKRMGLDYVDIFYHHRPDPDTPIEETLGAIATAVRQGKALYGAVSCYDGELQLAAAKFFKSEGIPFILNQSRYNLLDREIEQNGLLDQLQESQTGLIAFSPLAQGVLSGKYIDQVPAHSRLICFKPMKALLTEKNHQMVSRLISFAQQTNYSPAVLALAWVINQKQVTSALIGVKTVKQLDENLQAIEVESPLIKELERFLWK